MPSITRSMAQRQDPTVSSTAYSGSATPVATENASQTLVLLIDDDALFREVLAGNLTDAGMAVVVFGSGSAALEWLAGGRKVDAILLDWAMPELDGLGVLAKLQAAGVSAPVLFLTGHNQPLLEEKALAQGAVDFVDKTRSFAVILKRLELALGGVKGNVATPAPTQSTAQVGRLQLDLDSARAYWNGARVDLSVTEFKVVHALVDRGGRDLSYRQIYDLVRGEGFQAGSGAEGYRGNVRAMVKRIRQKFRAIDSSFEALQNYPGFGYRWSDGERG
jgi:two-component system, OmpR family, response regulator ChvI